jgi:hypothetical protein
MEAAPMNFNPQNQEGLLGLVAALKSGMPADTAYSVFQNIQQDQAQQIANRQARLSSLAQLLGGAASQGMTYQGAEALAQAQPGPLGPAAENILTSLYPETQRLWQMQGGQAQGYAPREPVPSQVSPVFQPDPMQQLEMQQAQVNLAESQTQLAQNQQELNTTQLWASLADDAQKYRAAGKTMQEFVQLAASVPQYQALFGAEPEQVQKVLQTIFVGATGA